MPPRDTAEPKITIPKWMWGLGLSVAGWGIHQSVELAVIRGSQTQILTRLDRLEEKTWQLRGDKPTAHTAALHELALTGLFSQEFCRPSPFLIGPVPSGVGSTDGTCRPHSGDR